MVTVPSAARMNPPRTSPAAYVPVTAPDALIATAELADATSNVVIVPSLARKNPCAALFEST
jgi:hypothetical protein